MCLTLVCSRCLSLEYDLVRSNFITDAFRAVDRKFFVPEESQEQAYFDCPIKEGNVHLSAPHMYCSVLENLDLKPSSKLSFLNIGSGSGYLSCLVGQILGPNSTSFGVEIKPDVLQHAKNSVLRIKNESDEGLKIPEINLFQGNGLHISLKGESLLGYDRIYVGAAIEVQHLGSVNKLLAPGGIMIVPVDYSLIKVMRPRIDASSSIFEFEVLSSVHFAEVIHSPVAEVTIPSIPWSPSIHKTYPNDFQDCLRTILLCNRCFNSSFHRKNTNYSTILPKELWLHIFTFMNKRCKFI